MTGALYVLRGAILALAWLLAVNVFTTAAIVVAARGPVAADTQRPAAFWLALRLGPAVVSIGFVVLFFLPSYWRYEPRELGEEFDLTLTMFAVAAVALLCTSAARGVAAWRGAAGRTRAWRRRSRPLTLEGSPLPAYAVDVATPILALAGVLRPRLLITRGVLDALTGEELRAGVAHELGHWRAWDNLKRLAMRSAPDLLSIAPLARAIESRWAAAAERDADSQACGDDRARCALASALVKVARLTPPPTPIAEPISSLVDGGEIASRVQRLLADRRANAPRRMHLAWLGSAAIAPIVIAGYAPLLRLVHVATEALMHTLP
jgi:Zn-dependent protease with chaperone function